MPITQEGEKKKRKKKKIQKFEPVLGASLSVELSCLM